MDELGMATITIVALILILPASYLAWKYPQKARKIWGIVWSSELAPGMVGICLTLVGIFIISLDQTVGAGVVIIGVTLANAHHYF